jgi:hypothetical protein
VSALVQIGTGHEASAQGEAYRFGGKEQGRGNGFHRRDELGDDDQLLAALGFVTGKERKPEAPAAQVFDFSQARHEDIGSDARLGHVNHWFQHTHSNPPQRTGDALSPLCDTARGSSKFSPSAASHAYQAVNA